MFNYKNKVVAITGASSGLGKQMAEDIMQEELEAQELHTK